MSTPLEFNTSTASATPKTSKKVPFSSSEKELLIALVGERPIIEDKRTHSRNIELKRQAWEELTIAFNAQPYVTQRNNVQLKRCWENIKTQRKKELAMESKEITQTGGGPPQKGPTTSSDNVVDLICPYINLTVPGVIDSNTIEIPDMDVQNMKKIEGEDRKRKRESEHCEIQVLTEDEVDENIPKEEEKAPCPKKVYKYTDSHSTNDCDENVPPFSKPEKAYKDIGSALTSEKKISSELEARIRRCSINIQQDQALHELRIQREKILIQREINILNCEREMHDLQKEKIKLEIEILKNKNEK